MSTDDFAGDAGVALSADAGADADALGLGPDSDSVAASSSPKPPQRVLACLLCQQRKIKCNRQFPCSNCTRTGAHCVPAGLVPRQRRRRFPERELLDRVRHYEALLRQHSVSFEPLHPPPPNAPSASPILSSAGTGTSSPDIARSVVTSPSLSEAPRARPRDFWSTLSSTENDPDKGHDDDKDDHVHPDTGLLRGDLRDHEVGRAWDLTHRSATGSNQQLLLGMPDSASGINLTASHPQQTKIFRLWNIYLDNVDPLLKVTHTPSLSKRVANAADDLANVDAPLEALLFSIYCVAIRTIRDDDCRTMSGLPKADLMASYQAACRQALANCCFLQSDDHDCLTAFFLYLVSLAPTTDPRSLSSLLAAAIRIARRSGYHSEAENTKCSVFEAEMRRRLWWALVVFDNRVCESFQYKTATLTPTWDCRPPLNLNDLEFRAEAKNLPPVSEKPTEAVFTVLRSEGSDFIRHSAFHLDFIDPMLMSLARARNPRPGGYLPHTRDLVEFQKAAEHKFSLCDLQNPLQYMTVCFGRAYLARISFQESCWRRGSLPSSSQQAEALSRAAMGYAFDMLACDTAMMTSPLTQGFSWYVGAYFPFLAYTYVLQRLRTRPAEDRAVQAWEIMSDNYEARGGLGPEWNFHDPFFLLFSRGVLQAWESRRSMLQANNLPLEPPRIVASIEHKRQLFVASLPSSGHGAGDVKMNEPSLSMPLDIDASAAAMDMGPAFAPPGPAGHPTMPPAGPVMDFADMNQGWLTPVWMFWQNHDM